MSIIHTKRFGLILRAFAPKPELVDGVMKEILETINLALNINIENKQLFSKINILVSADNRYGDTDCGQTIHALRDWKWEKEFNPKILHISEIKHGDIYCGMLNYGISHQMRERIDYSVILSSGVHEYLTPMNMEAIIKAHEQGARVVGIAITELTDSILAGRIANTFASWHNESLVTVGGFDLRASKPLKDDRLARYIRGWSKDKGEVFYNAAGVEEIIPLIRLIKLFGACIVPIRPQDPGAKIWTLSCDPEVRLRDQKKMATKYERQAIWAHEEDVDFSFIEGGILPLPWYWQQL
jgi:hypothetical protein